jgi:hypothetical protein
VFVPAVSDVKNTWQLFAGLPAVVGVPVEVPIRHVMSGNWGVLPSSLGVPPVQLVATAGLQFARIAGPDSTSKSTSTPGKEVVELTEQFVVVVPVF